LSIITVTGEKNQWTELIAFEILNKSFAIVLRSVQIF